MNALVDKDVIDALYAASCAGVKVDLIVRGICCLRPGMAGLSENITVRSIVGRFLEHSRIFVFESEGKQEVWLGSADWMPRNFFGRVEALFPVLDAAHKSRIVDEILGTYLRDDLQSRLLQPDGTWVRAKPRPVPTGGARSSDGACLARARGGAPRGRRGREDQDSQGRAPRRRDRAED